MQESQGAQGESEAKDSEIKEEKLPSPLDSNTAEPNDESEMKDFESEEEKLSLSSDSDTAESPEISDVENPEEKGEELQSSPDSDMVETFEENDIMDSGNEEGLPSSSDLVAVESENENKNEIQVTLDLDKASVRSVEPPESGNKKKLRMSFLAICILCAALIFGLCFSLLGWKRSNRQVSALEESNAQLSSSLDAVQSGLSEAQSSFQTGQSRSDDLEKQNSELESRAEAAEQQNADLRRQLEDVQSELKRADELKAKQRSAATPVPSAPGEKKLIALTFDDGPGKETGRLLDELKARGMKATFFVIGDRAAAYPDLLRRMADEGHEIGNHTYAHSDLTKLGEDEIRGSLTQTDDVIQTECGRVPTLMRPPGGNYNEAVKSVTAGLGQRIIYWTVDTRDWQSRNTSAIIKTAFQSGRYGIQDGAIVLMHDIYSTTVDAAVTIMDRLQKEGYQTVTVSELLALRRDGGSPGEVYSFIGK